MYLYECKDLHHFLLAVRERMSACKVSLCVFSFMSLFRNLNSMREEEEKGNIVMLLKD